MFLADEVQIMLTLTFGSANCQKMHRNKETNILKTRFPYGKLLREGAFENDLPSFLIVFFYHVLGSVFQITIFKLVLFSNLAMQTVTQCTRQKL